MHHSGTGVYYCLCTLSTAFILVYSDGLSYELTNYINNDHLLGRMRGKRHGRILGRSTGFNVSSSVHPSPLQT